MKTITIRGLDDSFAERLKELSLKSKMSVNKFIIKMIESNLSSKETRTKTYNDLDSLFGRWSKNEFDAIEKNIKEQRKIDKELW